MAVPKTTEVTIHSGMTIKEQMAVLLQQSGIPISHEVVNKNDPVLWDTIVITFSSVDAGVGLIPLLKNKQSEDGTDETDPKEMEMYKVSRQEGFIPAYFLQIKAQTGPNKEDPAVDMEYLFVIKELAPALD
jgi:hypothetical protein